MDDIEDALVVAIPTAANLPLPDCRRLTGPNMFWRYPGAVTDVFFADFAPERVVSLWQSHARRVLDAIGWPQEHSVARRFAGGVNLAISAPRDQLYSAVFAVQTAWHFCAADLLGAFSGDFPSMIAALKLVMAREANPALIALINAAGAHGIDVLCDDDALSLGHGAGAQTWPITALPAPASVDWRRLHDIPVALITGTNGKTTTTRLCAAIATAAGLVSGLTSTDFVRVGDQILDHGDYSGPGGARLLLRDLRLQIGFLEVARGGILRRGLPLEHAQAAAVLNVAADHLGEYGVNTVADLAGAKFSVHRALVPGGILVLNADDPNVVAEAAKTPGTIWWFSLHPDTPQIAAAVACGTSCAWLDGGTLVYFDGKNQIPVIAAAQIPIALNGRARYNIQNALAAICLSCALGIDIPSVTKGLAGFQSDSVDNPGRCNEFAYNGARVFVDFAHNPHSIAAVTSALNALPANRRFVMISHAGDRSDQDIHDLTAGAFALRPDIVIAAELAGYLRGRQPGEIPQLIRETCEALGMPAGDILLAASPSDGAAKIIRMLEPGDLALLLVHSEREQIFKMLRSQA
ncbi:MAG: Mur ligase family protein [Paracoccaceae bacterium]